jgi:hypothetical protein
MVQKPALPQTPPTQRYKRIRHALLYLNSNSTQPFWMHLHVDDECSNLREMLDTGEDEG